MNGVIIQFFHWYHQGDLWKEFSEQAEKLKDLGFSAVWFPPAVKCDMGKDGRGYDVYDLYDLGEFDQKGTVATKYGTKQEYLEAIRKARKTGIQVYADIVLNHRIGGDEAELITVQKVNEDNRTENLGEPFQGEAFTKFTFPGRKGKYSDFVWDYQSFSGIDVINKDNKPLKGIFKIHNEYGLDWNENASSQFGNYDYLMGADVEFRNPFVVQELKNWIKWYVETTGVDGLRLDALKHISSDFLNEWTGFIKSEINDNFFLVGEFWNDKADPIKEFSDKIENELSLFDVPLHFNFFNAAKEGAAYDLTRIFQDTLFESNPANSVSFVGNHDTQRLQSLESAVQNWFRPIAYAIILLSEKAYPCVFYPDLFGAEYSDKDGEGAEIKVVMPKVEALPKLLAARQKFFHGEQINYFDHPNCIAWIRKGDDNNPGCAVVISNSGEGYKEMDLGKENAGSWFADYLGNRRDKIITDENGKAIFRVDPGSVSVWTKI